MDWIRLLWAILITLICLAFFFFAIWIVSKLSLEGLFACLGIIGTVFIIYKKIE
jgi:hypothetical protein